MTPHYDTMQFTHYSTCIRACSARLLQSTISSLSRTDREDCVMDMDCVLSEEGTETLYDLVRWKQFS